MTNRTAFFVLGAALIIVALGGFLYFHHSQAQKAEIARLEAIAEQERQKARAAAQAAREQEERKLAALQEQALLEKERQAELERQRRLEEERRLEAERAERVAEAAREEARRKAEEAEARRMRQEIQREQERLRKVREEEAARQKAIREQQARITKFSFRIDPKRSKEIAVAQVYQGDWITIRVNRNGGVKEKLLVGVIPMRIFQYLQDPRRNSMTNRFFAPGPGGSATLVTMPLKDQDSFEVADGINCYHPYSRGLTVGTREGNILYIGTGMHNEGLVSKMILGEREGYFDISITIETKNQWGIKPRSLV